MYSCQSHRIFQLQVCVLLDCFGNWKLVLSLVTLGKSYFIVPVKKSCDCLSNTLRKCSVSRVVMKNSISDF